MERLRVGEGQGQTLPAFCRVDSRAVRLGSHTKEEAEGPRNKEKPGEHWFKSVSGGRMEHSQERLPARLEVGQEAEQARRPGRLWGVEEPEVLV